MSATNPKAPTRLIQNLRAGEPQKLVVYGTSLSNGMALILRGALQAEFGDLITVVNSALPGTASRTGLKFLEEKLLDQNPDTALLEWAINDAHSYYHSPEALDKGIDLAESQGNLREVIRQIRQQLPDCEILVQTTNPAWDPPGADNFPAGNRPDLNHFYEGYRQVAAEQNVRLLDAEPIWYDILISEPERFQELVADGVHPTPKAVRDVLLPFLLKELGV